mgnify:CR=1 FL=1|tara:strand:- start:1115 stop:1372 length:258 start_codon:yes stop_codon:yes gene_type:complete
MIKKKLKRLWNGLADIPDEDIRKYINKNETLEITVSEKPGEKMIISIDQMKEQLVKSKKNKLLKGRYRLVNFYWKPVDTRQQELL